LSSLSLSAIFRKNLSKAFNKLSDRTRGPMYRPSRVVDSEARLGVLKFIISCGAKIILMILFVHIEKTAGSTFIFMLRNSFGIHHVDSHKIKNRCFTMQNLQFVRKVFPTVHAISGHNIVEPTKNLKSVDSFLATFLRDPINRCASHYQDNRLRTNLKLSFPEWILDERHQNLMVKRIAGELDLAKAKELLFNQYDFVGITEYFNDSLSLLKIGSPYPLRYGYMRKTVAKNNSIKQDLLENAQTRELLIRYNDLDQQLYDFALNEIFRPMLEKNRSQLERIELPGEEYLNQRRLPYQMSIGYNKFIFRPLVKLMKIS